MRFFPKHLKKRIRTIKELFSFKLQTERLVYTQTRVCRKGHGRIHIHNTINTYIENWTTWIFNHFIENFILIIQIVNDRMLWNRWLDS